MARTTFRYEESDHGWLYRAYYPSGAYLATNPWGDGLFLIKPGRAPDQHRSAGQFSARSLDEFKRKLRAEGYRATDEAQVAAQVAAYLRGRTA